MSHGNDAVLDGDAKTNDNVWPRKDPLQEDDYNLLYHHKEAGPGNKSSHRVGNAFGRANKAPHKPHVQKACNDDDYEAEKEGEEQLG